MTSNFSDDSINTSKLLHTLNEVDRELLSSAFSAEVGRVLENLEVKVGAQITENLNNAVNGDQFLEKLAGILAEKLADHPTFVKLKTPSLTNEKQDFKQEVAMLFNKLFNKLPEILQKYEKAQGKNKLTFAKITKLTNTEPTNPVDAFIHTVLGMLIRYSLISDVENQRNYWRRHLLVLLQARVAVKTYDEFLQSPAFIAERDKILKLEEGSRFDNTKPLQRCLEMIKDANDSELYLVEDYIVNGLYKTKKAVKPAKVVEPVKKVLKSDLSDESSKAKDTK